MIARQQIELMDRDEQKNLFMKITFTFFILRNIMKMS